MNQQAKVTPNQGSSNQHPNAGVDHAHGTFSQRSMHTNAVKTDTSKDDQGIHDLSHFSDVQMGGELATLRLMIIQRDFIIQNYYHRIMALQAQLNAMTAGGGVVPVDIDMSAGNPHQGFIDPRLKGDQKINILDGQHHPMRQGVSTKSMSSVDMSTESNENRRSKDGKKSRSIDEDDESSSSSSYRGKKQKSSSDDGMMESFKVLGKSFLDQKSPSFMGHDQAKSPFMINEQIKANPFINHHEQMKSSFMTSRNQPMKSSFSTDSGGMKEQTMYMGRNDQKQKKEQQKQQLPPESLIFGGRFADYISNLRNICSECGDHGRLKSKKKPLVDSLILLAFFREGVHKNEHGGYQIDDENVTRKKMNSISVLIRPPSRGTNHSYENWKRAMGKTFKKDGSVFTPKDEDARIYINHVEDHLKRIHMAKKLAEASMELEEEG